MSEMVDRVTAALKLRAALSDATWEELAEVAVKTMREPTGHMGMIAARVMLTNELLGKDASDDQRVLTTEEAEAIDFSDHLSGNPSRWYMPVWRAMIDEALK